MISKEFDLQLNDVKYPLNTLIRDLGYKPNNVPDKILRQVQDVYPYISEHIKIRAGFCYDTNARVSVGSNAVNYNDTLFELGGIIAAQLKEVTNLVLFAASAGEEITQWYERETTAGVILRAFIINTIGSGIAEAAADSLETTLHDQLSSLGLDGYRLTNRLSPGYCGWNVTEQHKLFSLLPPKFCGIELSSSAVMRPLKSVSGIIGIGINANRQPYPCAGCSFADCYKRLR